MMLRQSFNEIVSSIKSIMNRKIIRIDEKMIGVNALESYFSNQTHLFVSFIGTSFADILRVCLDCSFLFHNRISQLGINNSR